MPSNRRLPSRLIALVLFSLVASSALVRAATPAANPRDGYAGFTQYYTLPYANDPGFGAANPKDPTIKLIVANTTFEVPLDTGSRALYLSAAALPSNITLNGPEGHVYLNSSGRIFNGTWTNTTVVFPDAVGAGGATGPATATMSVLVVQSVTCSAVPPPGTSVAETTFGTIPESGNVVLANGGGNLAFSNYVVTLTPGQVVAYADNEGILGNVSNFGVGFDRTGVGTAPVNDDYNQQYDAFFNLAEMRAGTMVPGYILMETAVQLGLTQNTTGYAYTNLAPTGFSQIPPSPPDWQAPTGTLVYGGKTYATGQLVIDIGISHGIMTLPGQPTSGTTVDLPITVNLINSGGAVSYVINNSTANLLNPVLDGNLSISWFAPLDGIYSENLPPYRGQLFNTGRDVLNAYNFLYDAAHGYLGLLPNGNSVPSAGLKFTAGFYPSPVVPSSPVINVQPVKQAAKFGGTVTFSASVLGNPPPTFQWQISLDGGKTWRNLTSSSVYRGATTDALTLKANASMNGNLFRVVATNAAGRRTSTAVGLAVGTFPVITGQPVGQTVRAGQTVIFTATATGTGPLSYAWYFNGKKLAGGAHVKWPNRLTMLLLRVTPANAGNYRLTVTNAVGSVTSNAVALKVR